ncbi:putative zinc ribbon protein [Yersinia intermedia]|uniref:putative zinc ribbon protein n=1 Tax=Yersinia intermedia TaxID=631 RepID=UPI0039080D83
MTPLLPRASLLHRTYFCVLCKYEYCGPKTCPQCQQHLYTTEARLTIAIGLPWVIQRWLNGSIIIDWRD